MIVNKEFFFFRTFDLDNRISKMYQDLVYQFNSKINCNDFFENRGFTLLIGSKNEEIYQNGNFYFLDCVIVFPSSLAYDCTVCWKINEDSEYDFYWTSNFPNDELADYIEKKPCNRTQLSKISNFRVFLTIPNSQNQKYIVCKKSLFLIKPKSPCATTLE